VELSEPFYALDGQIAIDLPGARALFTTASAGNLGLLTGDPAAAGNRDALADRLGVGLAWCRQVHGNLVHSVASPTDPQQPWIDGDGLTTRELGVAVLVLAADCLPIVITDGRTVAAVHAGWHGLEDGVIANAVARLGGGEAPITAAIGPAAGACCYEVGGELRERFSAYGAEHGANLDLRQIARMQLEAAGVPEVHDVGICTICSSPDELFSHRRDHGDTGRQAGLGWLTP
jgi:YfiH family protein